MVQKYGGTSVADSSGSNVTGTIVGAATEYAWGSGGPMTGAPNAAPSANAGADHSVTLPTLGTVSGSYTDDGITGTAVTAHWSKTSGPGAVIFGDANAFTTSVDFTATGTYVLTLTASDGEVSGSDDVYRRAFDSVHRDGHRRRRS